MKKAAAKGLAVAFIGSDGSGKTTVSAAVADALRGEAEVTEIYFGSGDGASSILRAPFVLARKGVDRRLPSDSAAKRRTGLRGLLRRAAFLPWALSLAAEKRGKLRLMNIVRSGGGIAVCDRFPQAQIAGFNDGPLLTGDGVFARWERRAYDIDDHDAPDLVVRLIASVDVALMRKPEMARTEIEERIAAVRSLAFGRGTKVIEIDADQPFDAVVGEVVDAIRAARV